MLEQDAGRKAHRIFAASSEIETGLSQINDPKQGARLVPAFLRITDLRFVWRSFRWSRTLGLLPRIGWRSAALDQPQLHEARRQVRRPAAVLSPLVAKDA